MGKHALLSASSSKRWLSCTPSARLEEQFRDEPGGSVYAEEGTAAHALAEHKLKKALKRRSKRPVSDYHCDEMEECTDGYVAFAMEQVELARQECKDPMVLIEQRLDYSAYVPEGFGTGDLLIVLWSGIFVTLMANKISFQVMKQSVPDKAYDIHYSCVDEHGCM